MKKTKALTIWFKDIDIRDVPIVGGKTAALGEMFTGLKRYGIPIPDGFAITAESFRYFFKTAGLNKDIYQRLDKLNTSDIRSLRQTGEIIRNSILRADLPIDLEREILKTYHALGKRYHKSKISVAVRSSATAEDLPGASFAGQQETYLNVAGDEDLLLAVKKCMASLFTDRAISYRVDKGFTHRDVSLSVAVQIMVRSDLAASGVMFTIDTETGFPNSIIINSSYGLGELVVQGKVTPDEFMIMKPLLGGKYNPIIERSIGKKEKKMVYGKDGTALRPVPVHERARASLSDREILILARWGRDIEKYFSQKYGRLQPMDIEWAKDGKSGKLFIVQARPETVHSIQEEGAYSEYRLEGKPQPLVLGTAVGTKISTGKVRVIRNVKQMSTFKDGEVLVTEITDPDWEPIMKRAAAIVTDKGGRTSHAAIVSRELGIPAIVGTEESTRRLKNRQVVTVDCSSGSSGIVHRGRVNFKVIKRHLGKIPKTRTKLMVNIGAPDEAMSKHYLPVTGVGLGRLEFIIGSHIGIHPNALINFKKLSRSRDPKVVKIVKQVAKRTKGHDNKKRFYVDKLSEGMAKIGAAFWPHPVIIRFSDFKTNEYRTLLGGELYEEEEANPMIGWRGASRYYDDRFRTAFGLECQALRKVRDTMGLTNVIPMVPFCRTIEEGRKVLKIMEEHGLSKRHDRGLKTYVMCEIPSNIVMAEDFLKIFDGMSIGSNDLTQLTLGIDRDSGYLGEIGNAADPAVKALISDVIKVCRQKKKYIGICGQAPSDFPEFARFLVKEGIGSISLSPDTVVKTLMDVYKTELRNKLRS